MDKLIIKGGKKLCGEVAVSGSKNAALPIFFATILAPGEHELRNVPALRDINTTIRLLETLGPGSFRDGSFPEAPIQWQQFVYFSYTTLTSSGYGDILPIAWWARSMANLEMIVGT